MPLKWQTGVTVSHINNGEQKMCSHYREVKHLNHLPLVNKSLGTREKNEVSVLVEHWTSFLSNDRLHVLASEMAHDHVCGRFFQNMLYGCFAMGHLVPRQPKQTFFFFILLAVSQTKIWWVLDSTLSRHVRL